MQVISLRAVISKNGNAIIIIEQTMEDGQLKRFIGRNVTVVGQTMVVTGALNADERPEKGNDDEKEGKKGRRKE